MKKIITILIFSCLLLCCLPLVAQQLSGYVNGMPSLIVQQPGGDTWWQMQAHNRLNFGRQITENLRMDAGVRNRFITGSEAMVSSESISADAGWLDLSWNWVGTDNYPSLLLNTAFDRLNITYEKGKWKLQAGRQRINWGQTFVWNPNDIFNTYSFFDFDYPERPGGDAFRTTYYHNVTSSSELAVSANHENKVTAALLHRWNSHNVDYQIIAGEQAETDIVIGGALTSDINGLNLRGEFSYFHPVKNLTDTSGIAAVSIGADYIFSNSLMLQTEVLYNNVGKSFSENGLMGLYSAPLSAKHLSISEWNVFAQATYPLTPRLNGSLSSMYFVDIQSCYAGLSLDYSVIENLDFSFITQFFSTIGNSKIGNMQILLGFARLKYSF
ncbi:MAG: hypothetical protein LBE79_01640 [Tannerella sp.]|jgi:hypothetical protein|nr:hypothetical protein [Tannerella sp.]